MFGRHLCHLNNKLNGVTGHLGAKTRIEPTPTKTVTSSAIMVTSRLVQVDRRAHHETSPNPTTAKTSITAITAYFSVPKNVVMSCGGRYGARMSSKRTHSAKAKPQIVVATRFLGRACRIIRCAKSPTT